MEIVLVTGGFPLRSQTFITAKAIGRARRGHQVTVLAGGPGDHSLDRSVVAELGSHLTVEHWRRVAAGVGARRARRVGEAAVALTRAMGRDPRFVGRLAGALRARHGFGPELWRRLERGLPFAGRGADIVHFEWAAKAAGCTELVELLAARVVVSCRGSDVAVMAPADARLADELRRLFDGATAVHCVSEAVLRAAESLGLDRSRAFVNHPAVDTRWFVPMPAPPSTAVRVLSVGRLHPVKGYDDALAAIRLLADRGHDVRFTIVGGGDPDVEASLRVTVHRLGLDDRVTMAGAMAPEDVRRQLQRADVFLLSSVSEGLSNAVLEAMATALPVVSTAVGGMAEAVRDGIDGLLVPPGDPLAMADALERLILDADLRCRLGRQGRQRACESFDLEAQLDRFESTYQRLAGGLGL